MVDLTHATSRSEQLLVTNVDYHVESGGARDDSIIDLYCRTQTGEKRILHVEGFRSNFFIHAEEFFERRNTLLKERRILAIECHITPGAWDQYLSVETLEEVAGDPTAYREAVESRFADQPVSVYHADVRDALDSDDVRSAYDSTELVRLFVEQPGHVAGSDGLRDHFDRTWEADIRFSDRFLIDSGIHRAVRAPSDTNRVKYENWPGASGSDKQIRDIEPGTVPVIDDRVAREWPGLRARLDRADVDPDDPSSRPDMPARTLTVDIEVLTEGEGFPEPDDAAMPVTAITAHDNYTDDYRTWVLDDRWSFDGDMSEWTEPGQPDPRVGVMEADVEDELGLDADIEIFKDETELLDQFNDWVASREFDLFTGWNTSFDYPYLINRSREVGAWQISEWGDEGEKPYTITGREDFDDEANVPGVVILDLLEAYQKTLYTALDSKKLENVADHVLGYGKAEPPGEDLDEAYHQHPVEFVRYNVRDVEATVEIDRTRGVRDLFDNLRQVTGARYGACTANWSMLDVLFLRRAQDESIALPTSVEPEESSYHGARVFDPVPGTHENVIYPDLASLYPLTEWTLNASPDVLYDTLEDARESGYSEDDLVCAPVDRRDWKIIPDGEEFDKSEINKDQYKGVKNEDGSQRAIFDPVHHDVYFVKPDVEEGFIRSTIDKLIELKNEYRGTDQYESVKRVTNSCFTPDTDVVTPDGVRNIRDLEVGDEVYSIDSESMTAEVKPVTEVIEKPDYDGELVDIDNSIVDFSTTPDHRMLVNRYRKTDEWETANAGDLNEYTEYRLPNDWDFDHNESVETVNVTEWLDADEYEVWADNDVHGRTFTTEIDYDGKRRKVGERNDASNGYTIPGHVYEEHKEYIHSVCSDVRIHMRKNGSWIPVEYEGDNWLELAAWYIAEGSARHQDSYESKGHYVGDTFSVNIAQKTSGRDTIKQLAEDMSLHASASDNGFTITSKVLYTVLRDQCGHKSEDKQIPEMLWDTSHEQKGRFFEVLVDADGDRRSGVRYTTVSEELKDGFVRLCVELGRNPRVREEPDSSTNHLVYRIRCSRTKNSFTMQSDGSTSTADKGVYCVQVEDNHTLMAGRNGNFQFVPNCYGVLGDSNTGGTGFRLYDWRIGEAITLFGRTIITETAEQIEAYCQERFDEDARVIGGDTDSAMISLPNAPDFATAIEWAEEAVDYLEGTGIHDDGPGHYDEVIEEQFNLDVCDPDSPDQHRMAVDIESLGSKLFFQRDPNEVFEDPDQATKKRYVEHIVWDEDDGWLDVDGDYRDRPDQDEHTELADRETVTIDDYTAAGNVSPDTGELVTDDGLLADQDPQDNISPTGFDVVRSDTADITDEAQMQLFEYILLYRDPDEPIYEYVSRREQELRNGAADLATVARTAGINNPLDDYGYDDDAGTFVRKAGPTYRGAKFATDHIPWESITPGTKPYRVYVSDVRPTNASFDLPEVYEYDGFDDRALEIGEPVDAVTVMDPVRLPEDAIVPDWKRMCEKEFRDRIEPILLTIDMTWDEIVGKGRQQRFGDGFAEVTQSELDGSADDESESTETETEQTGLGAF